VTIITVSFGSSQSGCHIAIELVKEIFQQALGIPQACIPLTALIHSQTFFKS
jgi:hypothetical protein